MTLPFNFYTVGDIHPSIYPTDLNMQPRETSAHLSPLSMWLGSVQRQVRPLYIRKLPTGCSGRAARGLAASREWSFPSDFSLASNSYLLFVFWLGHQCVVCQPISRGLQKQSGCEPWRSNQVSINYMVFLSWKGHFGAEFKGLDI